MFDPLQVRLETRVSWQERDLVLPVYIAILMDEAIVKLLIFFVKVKNS